MCQYPIVVGKANGNYSAYCPNLPGNETIMNMKETFELHIQGLKEDGFFIPIPSSEVTYVEVAQ